MNKEDFIREIKKLSISVDSNKLELLEKYKDYLIEYNSHTNLTAITKEEDIYLKHFYDSLTIVKAINLNNITSLIDIGTGAGFPGMVLKIFYPQMNVFLLDSNGKKTKFLEELKKILDVDVEIINDRVENYAKNNLNRFDIVTSRAVANLRVLSELSIPLVKEGGTFIPLKANIEGEIDEALDTIEVMNCKLLDIINFELYNSYGNRNILIIKKYKKTKEAELRNYDKIIKKPLVKHS